MDNCVGKENGLNIEGLKSACRSYLVNKKDYSSVTFVFYSLLSYSSASDTDVLNCFLKKIGDRQLELQKYIFKHSDLRYCIACFLCDKYLEAFALSINKFLNKESQIFDFLFRMALSSDNEAFDEAKTINLLNSLAITTLIV